MKKILSTILMIFMMSCIAVSAEGQLEFVSPLYENGSLSVEVKNKSGNALSAKNVVCLYNGDTMAKILISEINELASDASDTIVHDVSDVEFDSVKLFNLTDLTDIVPLGAVLVKTKDELAPTPTPTPYSNEPAYKDVPIVEINGDLTDISRDNEKQATLTYTSATDSFTSYVKIKWQGRSSVTQGYPKYNYSIKLYKDEAFENKDKRQFKTWLKAHNYCLKANWIDSTHARNIVSARLATKMNGVLPTGVGGHIDGFPVHIYINNEDYGVYTWNIPKKDWTFGMDSDNPNHIAFGCEQQTGACLFETESVSDNDWELICPDDYADDARVKLNRLITFIKDSSVEEFRENFNDYLDFDAVANYYVFAHIIGHTDGYAKNMLLYTFDGNIWRTGLYDMDSTYGLHWKGSKIIGADAMLNPSSRDATMYNASRLWSKLEQAFGNELYERYIELRADVLSDESIIAEFEYFADGIGQELYDLDESLWENRDINNKGHNYIPSRKFRLEQIQQYLIDREPYAAAWFEGLKS